MQKSWADSNNNYKLSVKTIIKWQFNPIIVVEFAYIKNK